MINDCPFGGSEFQPGLPGINLFVNPFRSSGLMSSGTAQAREQLRREAPTSEDS